MFEPGNQLRLGTKSPKLVQETIKRALVQEDGKRLRQAIEAQLDLAASGDLPALTFIRDTIEGKPAQAVTVSGDEDRPLVSMIKMIVVSANNNEINSLATIEGEKKTVIDDNSLTYPPLPLPPKVNFSDGGGV